MVQTKRTHFSLLIPVMLTVLLAAAFFMVQTVSAEDGAAPEGQLPDNTQCLLCHADPGQTHKFSSGDAISISVDPQFFGEGIHSTVSCQACHANISGYPHPENSAVTEREYTLQYKDLCKQCHTVQAEELLDSSHTKMADAGNLETPICADCHNPHADKPFAKDANGELTGATHARIANICAQCHSTIFEQYADSVHGSGVLVDKNPDVPSCTDCHGVHTISGPSSVASFRLTSPNICAKCHTDEAKMGKYGLSTQVLKTYIADFHGTTVTLFEKTDPDQQTNMPVCFDCHGVHNIRRADDPQKGLQVKENLLGTCQRCHPDATINFPDSWLSHYIPSPEHSPLVYYVGLVYNILIPVVLGVMALFILTDVYRKIRNKGKKAKTESPDSSTSAFSQDEK
ncbi:MAG TPA: cytochrome c3 family protein [Bellilinea sp.]